MGIGHLGYNLKKKKQTLISSFRLSQFSWIDFSHRNFTMVTAPSWNLTMTYFQIFLMTPQILLVILLISHLFTLRSLFSLIINKLLFSTNVLLSKKFRDFSINILNLQSDNNTCDDSWS